MAVPANASYITGTSVAVAVNATKAGYTSPSDVTRTLTLNLVAPSARTYTVPGSLKVGVAVTPMTPSATTDTDIASYGATGLPAGLAIDTGTGVISGTPSAASTGTASVTVTITDDAGNEATVSLTFPAVSKGEQALAGFAYTPSSLTFGDSAPSLTAPADPKGAVTYSATPSSVCTVNASTGALTIAGVGTCVVEATAAATADYEARTVSTTVTVEPAGTLALSLDAIAGDNVVNIAEKAAGFAIRGRTGTESGVSVTVTVGVQTLSATSGTGGAWSVAVPANASYITGTSVAVAVNATKAGYTSPSDVTRTLTLNLVAPSARTYTVPGSLKVGVAVTPMTPSATTDTDIASYGATGLPAGLAIDTGTGVISGTPSAASTGTASVTVTITDDAGNPTTVSLAFPAVSKGEQSLSGFGYDPSSLTFGDAAPSLSAPADPKGALTYSAAPPSVCTVNAGTGALTIVGAGACVVEATAAGNADYEAASEAFTVTVEPAGTQALTLALDAIAGDDVVNIAEKASGFAIRGQTGSESGASVTVTVGTETLTTTSGADGAWSVPVPADADYLTGTGVSVTVEASKTGFTAPVPVTRTLRVDLVAPSSPSWTVPASLKVGVAILDMTPSSTADTDIASYGATGLPAGLAIAAETGVISGTPSAASASTSSVTVTVTDTAGNEATISLTFPAVSKGVQNLAGFAYAPSSLTFGDSAPSLTAPAGAKGAVTWSATPSSVCTVNASTGALTIAGAGTCEVTATAAGNADYEAASEAFTVTVTERDVAGIRLTETTLDVPRGGTAIYGVKLTARPTGNVTVRITGLAGTDLTVTDANGVDLAQANAGLVFTTGSWEVDQYVTVAADRNAGAADYEVTITHRASGTDYGGVTASLKVTVAKRGVCHRDPNLREDIMSRLTHVEAIDPGDCGAVADEMLARVAVGGADRWGGVAAPRGLRGAVGGARGAHRGQRVARVVAGGGVRWSRCGGEAVRAQQRHRAGRGGCVPRDAEAADARPERQRHLDAGAGCVCGAERARGAVRAGQSAGGDAARRAGGSGEPRQGGGSAGGGGVASRQPRLRAGDGAVGEHAHAGARGFGDVSGAADDTARHLD